MIYDEVCFVFGSNLAGRHGKGAAAHAHQHWGAEYGVGHGKTGRAYALPTKDANLRSLKFETIQQNVLIFFDHAIQHPRTLYLLTPVGCGLAGHDARDLAAFLKALRGGGRTGNRIPDNVQLTASWLDHWPEENS